MNKADSHSVNIEWTPSVMTSGFEQEIDEPSSKFGQVRLSHLRTNIIGKSMNRWV